MWFQFLGTAVQQRHSTEFQCRQRDAGSSLNPDSNRNRMKRTKKNRNVTARPCPLLSTLALHCFIQIAPAAPLLVFCANPSAARRCGGTCYSCICRALEQVPGDSLAVQVLGTSCYSRRQTRSLMQSSDCQLVSSLLCLHSLSIQIDKAGTGPREPEPERASDPCE